MVIKLHEMLKEEDKNSLPENQDASGPHSKSFSGNLKRIYEISHNLMDYEVVQDIGRGQFGVVQKICLKTKPERFLVWKKIKYINMDEVEKRQLAQEVQLLQTLSHTNIVRYIGKINNKETASIYLIMEYCDGGDLSRYLGHTVRKGHFLPEELILAWFKQLVDALHYCHTREEGKVLHRDLKPQNILLSGKYKKLKLADFGLAKVLQPSQHMAQTHVGTPYYMSPELLCRSEYDEKSDIWSFGCLIYEMSTGMSPFSQASSYENLRHIVEKGILGTEKFPKIYVPELLSTIKWMLSNNPMERPTTSQLKETVLYKWAMALRYRDVSNFFQCIIQEKNRKMAEKDSYIALLKSQLASLHVDFSYLEEYVHFQIESDEAMRHSLSEILGSTKDSCVDSISYSEKDVQ